MTITGTDLTGATAVDFGTTPATNVVSQRGDADHGHQPGGPGRHGGRDGDGPGGTSATSSADQFTYVPPPAVTGISPPAGPIGRRHDGDDHGHEPGQRHRGRFRQRRRRRLPTTRPTQITATSPAGIGGHGGRDGGHGRAAPRPRRRPTSSPTWRRRRSRASVPPRVRRPAARR